MSLAIDGAKVRRLSDAGLTVARLGNVFSIAIGIRFFYALRINRIKTD